MVTSSAKYASQMVQLQHFLEYVQRFTHLGELEDSRRDAEHRSDQKRLFKIALGSGRPWVSLVAASIIACTFHGADGALPWLAQKSMFRNIQ